MAEFRGFDSIDDAMEFMARGENYGNRNLHPEQEKVTYGSYWIRFYDVRSRLIIFGYVDTIDEFTKKEAEGIDRITDPAEKRLAKEEVAYSVNTLTESHRRGFMWGWCHSKIERGEPGSTHRFDLWPCSRELFEAAKQVGWNVDRLPDERKAEVEQAYQGYRAHMLAVAATGDKP